MPDKHQVMSLRYIDAIHIPHTDAIIRTLFTKQIDTYKQRLKCSRHIPITKQICPYKETQ